LLRRRDISISQQAQAFVCAHDQALTLSSMLTTFSIYERWGKEMGVKGENPYDQSGTSVSLFPLNLQRFKPRFKSGARPSEERGPSSSLFKGGRNIWSQAHAQRAAFLIDADAFFRAFAEAAEKAEDQIIIVGWDTDSRTELPVPVEGAEPGVGHGSQRKPLGEFLMGLAQKKPGLRIYVLSWDFAFIYLLERESLPGVRFSTIGSERFRFVLDQEHPFWGSHHQKIVAIDDRVAFSGGLDITARRWDTPEHKGNDQRRVDPWGKSYGPFHDVQICIEGEAAAALGDLVRERWRQATGEVLTQPKSMRENRGPEAARSERPSPWPESARVAMENVQVGISRTVPIGYGSADETRPVNEVERLFLDMIREARRFIYIENQYFTSPLIAKALARRLRSRDGPDIVMVLPRDQTGWIEESTMGLLRSEALRIVEAADRYGRFRCFYPIVPNLGAGYVKVHSKVMIVDDQIVRVGSANLNSRSMGLDTECDLTIEALGRSDVVAAIANLRAELLGEHLGVRPAEFETRFEAMGSLTATVDSFRGGERSFVEIRPEVPPWVSRLTPPTEWIDPRGPRGIRRWIAKRVSLYRQAIASIAVFAVLIGLFLLQDLEEAHGLWFKARELPSPIDAGLSAWHWLRSLDGPKVAELLRHFQGHAMSLPLVLLGFVIGSFLFVPITVMILGVGFAYPRWQALALALGGSALAALATYGLGRYWAWSKSRFLARPWIQQLSMQISRGGVWAMMAIRLAPIAPFTAVSIVAGGLRIPVVAYMLGSVFGMLPGILALTVLTQEITSQARSADWFGALKTVGLLLVFFIGIPFLLRHWKRRRARRGLVLLALFFMSAGPREARAAENQSQPSFDDLCPSVRVETPNDLDLTVMEKRLLCGDPNPDAIGQPWSSIPINEAEYFFRSFLQSRGYHRPEFRREGEVLFVRPGPVTRLSRFMIEGGPPTWVPRRRRLIEGLPLTPKLLTDLQDWTLGELKNEGYPCPRGTSQGDPVSGDALVNVEPGMLSRIISIEDTGDTGLRAGVLDRYNAFRMGDIYRSSLISLTRRRTVDDAILQTLTLVPRCEPDGVHIVRNVTLGSGRLLRIGFGGSTETGARVRVIAKQSRVGSSASSLQARLDASFVQQTADFSARWYYSRGEARSYLEPVVTFNRQTESAFAARSVTTKLLHGLGWEESTGQIDIRVGPNFLYSESERGTGPSVSNVALIETTVRWISHDFELYTTSPRSGEFLSASGFFTWQKWGANFTAQKFELQGQKLWEIFHYDPPLLILGVRFNVSSVFSPDSNITSDLPVQFLSFAGGEQSLRGFERESLPRGGVGALSAAIAGTEARLHKVLWKKADAFVFTDAGLLGGVSFSLAKPLFLSPGLGVRWESPIGVFRAYAAQRFAVMQEPGQEPYGRHWRLGLTYGEEF
jgi:phosphatidylserine/phosphatidylglycerophosphate/cardiolipin synthase-like enzyme/uncharacterized membrane protein YdjX (TVP38/TMEM64 family)